MGRCGRQNMLPPYLKIWEWEGIFGRAVKAISSLGVRSPWSCVTNGEFYFRAQWFWTKVDETENTSWAQVTFNHTYIRNNSNTLGNSILSVGICRPRNLSKTRNTWDVTKIPLMAHTKVFQLYSAAIWQKFFLLFSRPIVQYWFLV